MGSCYRGPAELDLTETVIQTSGMTFGLHNHYSGTAQVTAMGSRQDDGADSGVR